MYVVETNLPSLLRGESENSVVSGPRGQLSEGVTELKWAMGVQQRGGRLGVQSRKNCRHERGGVGD